MKSLVLQRNRRKIERVDGRKRNLMTIIDFSVPRFPYGEFNEWGNCVHKATSQVDRKLMHLFNRAQAP